MTQHVLILGAGFGGLELSSQLSERLADEVDVTLMDRNDAVWPDIDDVLAGASLSLGPVIGFSDAMIFMMSIANVIGLYILAKTLRNEVKGHRTRVASEEFAPRALGPTT